MDTLQELIYFCKEEKHMGALLLMGEWGCGKTYLIEKELSEALENTHKIVRISLLGIDSIDNLNAAVRKEWLLKCTPFLGKLEVERNKLKKGGDFFRALGGILGSLNPMSGNIASALVAVDPMEYIPLEPVIEDLHNKGEHKRVILVFDDLSRSKLDMNHLMGTINGYSENPQ